MVVLDATTLTLLLNDKADVPLDPITSKPIERAADRVSYLVKRLQEDRKRILIPTPVLAEVLVQAGNAGVAYVQRLQKLSVFEIYPFDVLAAIELAQINREALETGDKRLGEGQDVPWQKIKTDRQAIAIAKVKGVKVIYTDDGPLGRFAARIGMLAIKLHTLPLPPEESPVSKIIDMFDHINEEGEPDVESEIEASVADNEESETGPADDGEPGNGGASRADAVRRSDEAPVASTTEAEPQEAATVVGDTLEEVMTGLEEAKPFVGKPDPSAAKESASAPSQANPSLSPCGTKKPDQ